MPYPKLSGILNNCALHALTPEIKQEVNKFATGEKDSNRYNSQYEKLKNDFAKYYNLDPEMLNWQQFAIILNSYNAFDTQIILGPVLRLFMKDEITKDEQASLRAIAIEDNMTVADYLKRLTDIIPTTARYFSLDANEISVYVANPLGLNIIWHQGGRRSESNLENPIATVSIYHQGDSSGAEAGGHWERTDHGTESIDYQTEADTQLLDISTLLESEVDLTQVGLAMLEEHIHLTFNSQATDGTDIFAIAFAELSLTAAQIAKYLKNIRCVPKELAITLLGDNPSLTEKTKQFIAIYNFTPVLPGHFYERYILQTNESIRNAMRAELSVFEQSGLDYMLQPVSMPESAARRLAAYTDAQEKLEHEVKRPSPVDDSPSDEQRLDHPPAGEKHDNQHQFGNNDRPGVKRPRFEENVASPRHSPTVLPKKLEEARKNFFDKLVILAAKRDKLQERKETDAYKAAKMLHEGLFNAGNTYFKSNLSAHDFHTFKTTCDTHLKNERPELEKNRGLKLIVANIVLSLSVIYLIAAAVNYAVKGRFGFFPTDSAKKVDDVEESLKKIGPPAST